MKPIRIWYQSYVDYDNGKTYWDRLRKHLDEIADGLYDFNPVALSLIFV